MVRHVLFGLAVLLASGLAHGHPLGNNTVNRQAAIQVTQDAISVRYLVDMAEIPTLLAAQEADANADGTASPTEWDAYAHRYAQHIQAGLDLTVSGKAVSLVLTQTQWTLAPGAAGLNTMRLEAHLKAPLVHFGKAGIEYLDRRFPEEQGWKEVLVKSGKGVRLLASDVPQTSRSRDLTLYPQAGDELPNRLTATTVAAAIPVTSASTHATDTAARTRIVETSPATLGREGERHAQPLRPAQNLPRDAAPTVNFAARQPNSSAPLPILAFFHLGAHHIATGWDHLVFLLGLLVAHTSLRRLVWVITAFTAAHSLTLALAAGGLVNPPGSWIEPAIALTIAYVGLSNLRGNLRHGAALAFVFGLVHGFGFAGALLESLAATPTGGTGWLLDLAAFNLGIEAFQLALILTLLPVLRLAVRHAWFGSVRQASSIAVLGAGLGWFFARI